MNNREITGDVYSDLLGRFQDNYPFDGSHKQWMKPQMMILLASGDLGKAIEIVVKNLVHPIGIGLVACILVEECIRDEVIKKIRASLVPMDERIQRHPNYQRTIAVIDRLNCQTIHLEEFDEDDTKKRYGRRVKGSPIVVLDFPQYYFGDKPSAVVTMSTFRSMNEVSRLYTRERVNFETTSVWSSKLAQCFDLVTRIKEASNWTFNCSSHTIRKPTNTTSVVSIERSIHYEIHDVGGKINTIAFPISQGVQALGPSDSSFAMLG